MVVEEDLEEIERMVDKLANELPGNAALWTAINKIQLALYDYHKAIEEFNDGIMDLRRALLI